MKTTKRQNPLIPILICACGWLFGQGVYELARPVALVDYVAGVVTTMTEGGIHNPASTGHHAAVKHATGTGAGPAQSTIVLTEV